MNVEFRINSKVWKKQYYIDQAVPQILIFGVLVSELPQVPDDAALEHIICQEMP